MATLPAFFAKNRRLPDLSAEVHRTPGRGRLRARGAGSVSNCALFRTKTSSSTARRSTTRAWCAKPIRRRAAPAGRRSARPACARGAADRRPGARAWPTLWPDTSSKPCAPKSAGLADERRTLELRGGRAAEPGAAGTAGARPEPGHAVAGQVVHLDGQGRRRGRHGEVDTAESD